MCLPSSSVNLTSIDRVVTLRLRSLPLFEPLHRLSRVRSPPLCLLFLRLVVLSARLHYLGVPIYRLFPSIFRRFALPAQELLQLIFLKLLFLILVLLQSCLFTQGLSS